MIVAPIFAQSRSNFSRILEPDSNPISPVVDVILTALPTRQNPRLVPDCQPWYGLLYHGASGRIFQAVRPLDSKSAS